MIKDGNYIVVQSFMVNELHLKGNELLIYAIIYGFSQTEGQVFSGSLQYLAEWTNSTKQGVLKALKGLVEKGYLVKNKTPINGVNLVEYYATKFNGGSKQSLIGVLNKVERGIKQSLPNNIENNIRDNIRDINNSQFDNEFDVIWQIYPRKQGKSTALKAYIKARQSGVEYQDIKQGVEKYVEYIRNNNIEQRFIKQGSTWFNQQCWNDEYSKPRKKTSYDLNEVMKLETLDFIE